MPLADPWLGLCPETHAHHLWWMLLRIRLEHLRWRLPEALHGTIACAVTTRTGMLDTMGILVRGKASRCALGPIACWDARLETTEEEVQSMLAHFTPQPGSLRVRGDADFFFHVFRILREGSDATSWVGVRSSR